MSDRKKILVAPLDWGLGHAARCAPVISSILTLGHEVVLASSGSALRLLQMEFPRLRNYELPAYRPKYGIKGSMVGSMALQLPHFMAAIYQESRALKEIIRLEQLNAVISDNRYGLSTKEVPSVFITHQLQIQMPAAWSFLGGALNSVNHRLINKYTECWVPDVEGDNNLSGDLSHGVSGLKRVRYIGPLSRLSPQTETGLSYEVLVVLSGPEPQRSFLEMELIKQLTVSGKKSLIVRGLPGGAPVLSLPDHIHSMDYMGPDELQKAIASARYVIARSGYSTIMDLVRLQKPALLVPTPGQTEQEYLGKLLKDKGGFAVQQQDSIDIARALAGSQNIDKPVLPATAFDNYKGILKDWLESL